MQLQICVTKIWERSWCWGATLACLSPMTMALSFFNHMYTMQLLVTIHEALVTQSTLIYFGKNSKATCRLHYLLCRTYSLIIVETLWMCSEREDRDPGPDDTISTKKLIPRWIRLMATRTGYPKNDYRVEYLHWVLSSCCQKKLAPSMTQTVRIWVISHVYAGFMLNRNYKVFRLQNSPPMHELWSILLLRWKYSTPSFLHWSRHRLFHS